MTGEPRWLPEAIEDLQSGHDWYDEREPCLGQHLAAEVFKALDQVVRHSHLLKKYEHPNLPAQPDVRKMQVKRFDEYGLVYTVVNDRISARKPTTLVVGQGSLRPECQTPTVASLL